MEFPILISDLTRLFFLKNVTGSQNLKFDVGILFFQRKKSKWRVRFSILILIFLWTDPLIDSTVTLPPRALRCAGWRQSRICSSTAPPPCWPSTNSAAAQLWPPAPPRTAHGADHSRVGPTANCEPERSLPVKRTPTERLMGKKVKQKTVLTQGRNNNVYLGGPHAHHIYTDIGNLQWREMCCCLTFISSSMSLFSPSIWVVNPCFPLVSWETRLSRSSICLEKLAVRSKKKENRFALKL